MGDAVDDAVDEIMKRNDLIDTRYGTGEYQGNFLFVHAFMFLYDDTKPLYLFIFILPL